MQNLMLLKKMNPIGKSLYLLRAVQNKNELSYLYTQLKKNDCKKVVLYEKFDYNTNNSAYTLLFLRWCMEHKLFIENGKEEIPDMWISFKRPKSYFLKKKDLEGNYLSLFIDTMPELRYIDLNLEYVYKKDIPFEDKVVLEKYAELGVYLEYDNMWIRWFRRVQRGDKEIWIQ